MKNFETFNTNSPLNTATTGRPPVLFLDLDELSEDPVIRKAELQALVTEKYEEAKASLKDAPGLVKNGTYLRTIKLLDPIEGEAISISIRIQRYLDKDTGKTSSFYGGLFVSGSPCLACQILTVLGQKAADSATKNAGEKATVRSHCASWGISTKTYYRWLARIRSQLLSTGMATMAEVRMFLTDLYYARDKGYFFMSYFGLA